MVNQVSGYCGLAKLICKINHLSLQLSPDRKYTKKVSESPKIAYFPKSSSEVSLKRDAKERTAQRT